MNTFGRINGGYILQPRIFDLSESSKMPPVTRELWFYLLRNVNFSDNGKIKRGQGFFRLSDIQESLSWYVGYRKMKYSKPQLTKSLRRLREENMIATAKETRGLLVTVCNFDYFQNPTNYEGNDEGTTKEQRRKSCGHTILKEGKEERIKETSIKNGKHFLPPSISEITEYCKERKNNVDPEKWLNFYESKGWMIGKNKMKDWRAAVRTWENNAKNKANKATKTMTVSESLIIQREKIAEAMYNDADDPFNSPARRAALRAGALPRIEDD